MARVGINPARGKDSAYQPARVSAAVLTYIPHQAGYFKHRLQVLQLTLNSLRANAQLPCDLLVFDNGSCAPVVEYLTGMREAGQIDYLILSKENVGKIGALMILFQAAPGEVIAYSDDDILFYPGWLEPQLALLDGIPNAGMVSGVPVRFAGTYAVSSVERLLENGPAGLEVTRERFIPDGWEIDWAQSTGREPGEHLQAMKNWSEFVLRCGDLTAVGSANHFQFVARKEVILKALPEVWTGQLMGAMVEMDEAIDRRGYLRLSTSQRYTRHLGNVLSPGVIEEAEALGIRVDGNGVTLQRHPHWLMRLPGSRRVLRALYDHLFRVLH